MILALAAWVALAVPAGRSAASHGPDFQKMQQAMAELEQKAGQDFEAAYINGIIPHHEDAIAMAMLVEDDAPHQQTRDLAARMISDQQKEIGDLSGWLKQWYGMEINPDPRMKMSTAMIDEMMKLDPVMKEKHFLAMMREHHQSAIDMGGLVVAKATHQELKDQAQMMMTMQKDEQDRLGGWLQTWYAITPPTPTGDMLHGMEAVMAPMPAPTAAPATAAPAPTAAPAAGAPGSLPNTGATLDASPWSFIGVLALLTLGLGFLLHRLARQI
jgi:uncharacterized protein (DUF305 family)